MDKELEQKVAKLQEMIDGSDNIVFFGGAGVSTESGYLISEARTGCIIRNMTILRRQYCPTDSL